RQPRRAQQGADVGIAAAVVAEQPRGGAGAAPRQDRVEKLPPRVGVEHAALTEALEDIAAEHLGPLVAVVAGRIAAGEDVAEAVLKAVALRHRIKGNLLPYRPQQGLALARYSGSVF